MHLLRGTQEIVGYQGVKTKQVKKISSDEGVMVPKDATGDKTCNQKGVKISISELSDL